MIKIGFCVSLTTGWLVCCCLFVVDGVVAEETMKQLHRYRTPHQLHSAARDPLHHHFRTS